MDQTVPPSTILVLGSGVFGLTLTYELLLRPKYKATSIILVSPAFPTENAPQNFEGIHGTAASPLWNGNPDLTASVDTTRIIRGDYADPEYASLAREAQEGWRDAWGAEGRYSESGLLLTGDRGTTGADYVGKSLDTVMQSPDGASVQDIRGIKAVAQAMQSSCAVGTGDVGYLNGRSGWADAGASMRYLYGRIKLESGGRVRIVRAAAEKLLCDPTSQKILGCSTSSGEEIKADLTVLATGAWTPALIDLTGIASARGQSIMYVDMSAEEATALKNIPVHLNLSRGCFVFPPTRRADGSWELKLARHAYGVANPVRVRMPFGGPAESYESSLPAFPQNLPVEDEEAMQEFVKSALPLLDLNSTDKSRGIRRRMCWYLDTHSGDFIVGPHPSHAGSLFLATAGCGHGFKFLPALGKRLVDVLEGADERMTGGVWSRKWAWPECCRDGKGNVIEEIWCQDGSRAGRPGMRLSDALPKPQPRCLLPNLQELGNGNSDDMNDNKPNKSASRRQAQPTSLKRATSTQKIPAAFSQAPETLSPFLKHLDKSKVYIVHLDTVPWQFKRKIFTVPVALNVTIVILLTLRLLAMWRWYLDLFLLSVGYASNASVPERDTKAFSELAAITAWRTLTIAFDFVVFRVFVPWPMMFFTEQPANPALWRWRVGFQDTEIVVRSSLKWGTQELWESYKRTESDEKKNVVLRDKIMPAIDGQWMRGRTGYLMMGKDYDLDFASMIHATELVEDGTLSFQNFRKMVLAYSEDEGWLAWTLHELDKGAEEEARKRIILFKERLTAMRKESLFFRWIELIQYESSQPGGFTAQRQERAMQKAKQLFEKQGIDFEKFIRSIGGLENFPGFDQAAA